MPKYVKRILARMPCLPRSRGLANTMKLSTDRDNRGHPLADRSQARTPYPPAFEGGFFLALSSALLLRPNPFPRCWLRPNRACHPYGSSKAQSTALALAEPRPRETLVPPMRPDKDHRSVARVSASSPQLAHPADDPVQQHGNNTGGDGRASTQTTWLASSPQCWLACRHQTIQAKQRFTSKGCPSLSMW
jgi:hypothetical protein